MGNYARLLRTLCTLAGEPCVIVNCHPTKNAGADNLQPAGGGAFIAEMDGNLTCRREGAVAEIHWQGKFRGPEFSPAQFELVETTLSSLKDSKGRNIKSVVAKVLNQIDHSRRTMTGQGDQASVMDAMRENEGASLSFIAVELQWLHSNGKPAKSRVQRVMEKLVDRNLVKKLHGKFVLTRAGLKAKY